MELSVIIVNYNVKFFLEHCLLSALKASKNIDAEIIVFDNASTDNSKEYLEPAFPAVRFIWSEKNLGFAKANNRAASQAAGKYILFLNPDTILAEDCFTKCIDFFHAHADCGALGVRMIDGSGRFLRESKRGLPTPAASLYKISGLTKIFPSSAVFAKYYAGGLPEHEINKTDVLAGACMMLSRQAFEITRGFDEAFFMYGEDIDLSYRILKAGLNNYYFPATTIIHFKGESAQQNSYEHRKNFYGAMKLFAQKHYGDNAAQRIFMNAGIAFAKALASFHRKGNDKLYCARVSIKTMVLGSPAEFSVVKLILKNNAQYIAETNNLSNGIAAEKSNKNIRAIVFCEGSGTFKAVIELLQKKPSGAQALFFSAGAKSIIGSDDKNKCGIAISAQ